MRSFAELLDDAVDRAPIGGGYNWRFRYILAKRGLCIVDWDRNPLPDRTDYPVFAPLPDYTFPDAWPLAALVVDAEDAILGTFGEVFVPRESEMTMKTFYEQPTGFKSQGGYDRLMGIPRVRPVWMDVETKSDRDDLAAYYAGWDTVDLILEKVPPAKQAEVWALDVEEGHQRFWVEPSNP